MLNMKTIELIARILVIVGALNWGLVAIGEGYSLDIVARLSVGWLITTVYALVGLAGIWEIIALLKKK
jgi:uncharacterized membrane protein YuzA (DUF378 family)